MLVFGVFSLVTAWAGSIDELLLYRFITGVGLGGAMPNIIALTSEYAPARLRATLVTVMFCGFPFGSTLGGLLSAPLISAFGWPSVFIVGGVAPLVTVVVLAVWLPESVRYMVAHGKPKARIAAVLARLDPEHAARATARRSMFCMNQRWRAFRSPSCFATAGRAPRHCCGSPSS